ncbi:hypothetical protein [Pseudoalteromonas sp. A757]|uniref:hypothetical protein n=1 Tax=Pseudoalteromonas sp. A757 TaxID=2250709 RepID=UPI00195FC26C|nr:hypothetical protein [Pseudoalteromonas sp. A757]
MDGQGEDAADCDHKVSHGLYPSEAVNIEYCEVLQYIFEQFESVFKESAKAKQIDKCKI